MAKYSTLKALFTAIANSLRGKIGSTYKIVADDFPEVIDGLSTGGITPSGTKEITANGTHDVTGFASALVNVPTGLNARIFTTTVASDVTSGNYVIAPANEYIASIRSNPNAFVMIWMLDQPKSTALYSMWMAANFTLMNTGATAKNTVVFRTTTAGNNITLNTAGMTGENKSAGHITVLSDGSLRVYACNTTYPVKAGTYKILAGTLEML